MIAVRTPSSIVIPTDPAALPPSDHWLWAQEAQQLMVIWGVSLEELSARLGKALHVDVQDTHAPHVKTYLWRLQAGITKLELRAAQQRREAEEAAAAARRMKEARTLAAWQKVPRPAEFADL